VGHHARKSLVEMLLLLRQVLLHELLGHD
jgi:hypothetical protein